ncbi:MAG: response regulator [Anaerolineales bacterium]
MIINVYIVDDHAIVRDGLSFLLEAQPDIRVVGRGANGREAVQDVLRLRPHVVVMDIAMPELNGIEATQQISELAPDVQVIILSIHSAHEHIYRALEAGARGYLLKESAGVEVSDAVRAVHAGHRYMSQKISDRLIEDYIQQRQLSAPPGPLSELSQREREVLQLVVEGKSSAEIAEILSLSPKTVETYRSRLMHKLEIEDLPSLVKFAIRHGLTSLQ